MSNTSNSQSLFTQNLISVNDLHAQLNNPNLVILDSTWFMPSDERDGALEWQSLRIPNAQFFDYDRKVCAPNTDLPHMMPSPELFNQEVRKLGINNNSQIVIYERYGLFSGARAWWMFKAMGHEQVVLLDGGLQAWLDAGFDTQTDTPKAITEGDFTAQPKAQAMVDAEQVLAALSHDDYRVLDARSAERFFSQVPEPRPEIRSGHMPNALNLPFFDVLDKGHLLNPQALATLFKNTLGEANNRQLIFSCGSGVTACILALAATQAGYKNISVYDGSWTEWGLRDDLPVV